MSSATHSNTQPALEAAIHAGAPAWARRASVLWLHRRLLMRVAAISSIASLAIAFAIPKQYKSVARIMPPDQAGPGAMMLAALAGRAPGLNSLGALAGGLLGGHSTTALFCDLLRSGTVSGHLIDRFQLQSVYGKRYRIDTAKRLARSTKISDDKKSGVITIEVEDTEAARARDLTQAYLDELNKLVNETTTSTARRERIFIEGRLLAVQADLEEAQLRLSEFSSRNSAVDLKEQTRAMVDVASRIEGELLAQKSSLESLRQIYGEGNVRVREAEARIGTLERQLNAMAAPAGPLPAREAGESAGKVEQGSASDSDAADLYPRLRQLPRLAVPYADLYRRVKVQETVYELLTQQYELTRIEEAKDVPVVSVIDAPGIAEKKSFPPRLLLTLGLTAVSLAAASVFLLLLDAWADVDPAEPAKVLAAAVMSTWRVPRFHRNDTREKVNS